MKLAILVLIASLFVGGGGFLAYQMLVEGKTIEELKALVIPEPPEEPEDAPPPPVPAGVFLTMRPIHVTALHNGVPNRHVSITFVLEFPDQAAAAIATPQMQRLHHAFLEYMHTISQFKQFDDVRDAPLLRRKLQGIADDMLGAGIVRSILIQGEERNILKKESD